MQTCDWNTVNKILCWAEKPRAYPFFLGSNFQNFNSPVLAEHIKETDLSLRARSSRVLWCKMLCASFLKLRPDYEFHDPILPWKWGNTSFFVEGCSCVTPLTCNKGIMIQDFSALVLPNGFHSELTQTLCRNSPELSVLLYYVGASVWFPPIDWNSLNVVVRDVFLMSGRKNKGSPVHNTIVRGEGAGTGLHLCANESFE